MLRRSVPAVTAAHCGAGYRRWCPRRGQKIPPHQRFTLANGVKLILIPRHDVPLIAFEACCAAAARLDAGWPAKAWHRCWRSS
jgi:hypothetical protein